MKKIAFLFAASVSLCLAACSPTVATSSAGNTTAVADIVEIESTRALIVAELAYQSVAQAALAGIQSGLIQHNDAVAVRNLNRTATAALVAAKAAHSATVRAAEVAKLIDATAAMRLFAQSGAAK